MMERENESWRDAPNTNGAYRVSNLGRVARVVARLGLAEERCQMVNKWAVAEVRK